MKLSDRFLCSTLALAIAGLSAGPAFAAQITDWNQDNVVGSGPDSEGTYFSTVYDKAPVDSTASSSGYIKYDLDEGAAPGLKVVNDAPVGVSGSPVDNCIMAAGSATCNGPFQSGKRFKLDQTGFDPIDLVFDLNNDSLTEGNDGLYRVFQKYGNNTGSVLGGFNIGLGFGIGDDFTSSSADDGDPSTDAILMAHLDGSTGKWIMNRGLDDFGEVETLASGNEGDQYGSIADVEAALQSQAGDSGLTLAGSVFQSIQ